MPSVNSFRDLVAFCDTETSRDISLSEVNVKPSLGGNEKKQGDSKKKKIDRERGEDKRAFISSIPISREL